MRTTAYKHYIEILPAALLSQREMWHKVAYSLPDGGCLLVTNPNDKQQTAMMQALAQFFRRKGRQVIVWASKHTLEK